MKMTIYNEPLWYKEWRDLGFECVNGPKTLSLNISQKNENFSTFKKSHDILIRKAKKIKNLQKYFLSYQLDNNEILCLADFILNAFYHVNEFSKEHMEETLIQKFRDFHIDELREDTLKFIDFQNDVIASIRQLNIDNEAKLDIIETLYHPAAMIHGLFDIFRQFEDIYQSLNLDHNLFHSTQNIKENDLRLFFEHIGLNIDETPLYIYPSFANYHSLVLLIEEDHYVLLMGAGLESQSLTSYHESRNEQQKLEYFLKVLSDKSKFEILTLLKKKSMYGNELAKAMHLKTPTISYHMDALISGDLIHIRKENNRIYYSLNKEEIEHMIQYLHHKLLKDEN